jgi:uncharacterized protein
MTYKEKVDDFLLQRLIAVAGVSRNPQSETGNAIYKKFRDVGYKVFPVNPFAEIIEGDKCYPNLLAIPEKPGAVFIITSNKVALDIVKQCIEHGIKRIWFHHAIGNGSYNREAANLAEANGITVIHNGCPMMFVKDADGFHKFMAKVLKIFGKLKR